jgi:hypothetical protein
MFSFNGWSKSFQIETPVNIYISNDKNPDSEQTFSSLRTSNQDTNLNRCDCGQDECKICWIFNNVSTEKITKILLDKLINSIKEEILSTLISNSITKLNKNKISKILSNIDLTSIANKNENTTFLKKKRRNVKIKAISACPHTEKKHYAKNMCYNCYHRQGRDKKAWNCRHSTKPHYALGMCHNCYQNIHTERLKAYDNDDISYVTE